MMGKIALTIFYLLLNVAFVLVIKEYLTVREENGVYAPKKFIGIIVGFTMIGLMLGDILAIIGLYKNLKFLDDDKWIFDCVIVLSAIIIPAIRNVKCKKKMAIIAK